MKGLHRVKVSGGLRPRGGMERGTPRKGCLSGRVLIATPTRLRGYPG